MLNEWDVCAIRDARLLALQHQDKLAELNNLPSIRSARLDKLPVQRGGDPVDLSRLVIRKDQLLNEIEALERRQARARRRAEKALRHVPDPRMRIFLETYYLDVQSFEIAQNISGASARRCREYKAAVGDI